jgi:hypothetical protein
MASITIAGTFTAGLDSISKFTTNLALSLPMSGSNLTATNQNLTTASWQGLDTSSLSDLRYFSADNTGSGSIQIATDNSGSNVIAKLAPNDTCLIPWSGSTQLYAKAFTTASVLYYVVTES